MDNYFFDFDGTLANSGEAAILATQEAFREAGLKIPVATEIRYFMGIPIEVSFKELASPQTLNNSEFEQLLKHFRISYQKYEENNLQLFDGIQLVLKKLKAKNKKLFVISSKHSLALERNLVQLNIFNYFDNVIGSDQVSNYKPAPDGILQLLSDENLSSDSSVMIGDATFDIQMGKNAGVYTCAVTWGAHNKEKLEIEKPDYLVNNVSDILFI